MGYTSSTWDAAANADRVMQVGADGTPSGSGGGDASAANQVSANTKLDTLHTDMGTLVSAIGTVHSDMITLEGYVDALEGFTDGIEGKLDSLIAVEGATSDAAVTTNTTGSISGKLRGVVKLLIDLIAKTPALGTAGSAATDVITVQGIASGTALKTDTSGGVQGFTANSTATITRPADTTAYAAKDAISSSTSAPAILTFANCARASGGSGYVTSARVVTNQAACVSAFRLHLYDATLSAVNDNAAQTVLETNWGSSIGYIDFPAMATDGSDTAGSQTTDKPLPFVAAGTSLFGMLETITGFTPASAQHFQIKLGIEQN